MLFRELTPEEVRKLLTTKAKRVYDPVVYKGLPVAKHLPVRRFTLQKIIFKTVNEEDASILLRSGWEIISIHDPDDDDE